MRPQYAKRHDISAIKLWNTEIPNELKTCPAVNIFFKKPYKATLLSALIIFVYTLTFFFIYNCITEPLFCLHLHDI